MKFYTNVQQRSGKIFYRGVENGKRVYRKLDYSPTLYLKTDDLAKATFRTIKNQPLIPVNFKTIYEAKDFLKLYDGVADTEIFGMRRFEYSWIDEYAETDWSYENLRIARLDIEVASENGFPEQSRADEEVTLIGMKIDGHVHVWGCGEFQTTRKDVTYYRCETEAQLLMSFVNFWSSDYPDILTGWNVSDFDITYLVNRITKILGESVANRLSPWGVIYGRSIKYRSEIAFSSYTVLGVAILDSMDLYKKFSPEGQSQSSWRLDNIGFVEVGEKKLDYSDVGSLHKLYKTDFQRYTEYNIQDIELDEKIDDKYKLLDLILHISYINKVNYEDVFMQVRMWTAIVDNNLKKYNIALNHGILNDKAPYSGGFVLEPQIGLFQDVVSYDLTSLYPHLIMQYNIGPDTLVQPENYTDLMRKIISEGVTIEKLLNQEIDTEGLKKENVCITPNGQFFRIDHQSFLARIMEEMYNDRNENKKKQLAAEKILVNTFDVAEKHKLINDIARYKSLQMALKVGLNSAYGALGSEFFVLYDKRLAEAITTSGRLGIQWIGKKANEYLQQIIGTKKDYILAQDTDSMYLTLHDLVLKSFAGQTPTVEQRVDFLDKVCSGPLNKVINQKFEELKNYTNAYAQKMIMKREVIADMGFWTGKKKYALSVWDKEGVRYNKAKIKVVGLESVRSTTPTGVRPALERLIELVLCEGETAAQAYIREYRNNFAKFPINEIALSSGVNGLAKYSDSGKVFKDGTPQHVKAALIYNHYLKMNGLDKKYESIKNGNKIKYAMLKSPNPVSSEVLGWENVIPEELNIEKYIDYDAIYERTFLSPVRMIMESCGWHTEKTISLEDLFV